MQPPTEPRVPRTPASARDSFRRRLAGSGGCAGPHYRRSPPGFICDWIFNRLDNFRSLRVTTRRPGIMSFFGSITQQLTFGGGATAGAAGAWYAAPQFAGLGLSGVAGGRTRFRRCRQTWLRPRRSGGTVGALWLGLPARGARRIGNSVAKRRPGQRPAGGDQRTPARHPDERRWPARRQRLAAS